MWLINLTSGLTGVRFTYAFSLMAACRFSCLSYFYFHVYLLGKDVTGVRTYALCNGQQGVKWSIIVMFMVSLIPKNELTPSNFAYLDSILCRHWFLHSVRKIHQVYVRLFSRTFVELLTKHPPSHKVTFVSHVTYETLPFGHA